MVAEIRRRKCAREQTKITNRGRAGGVFHREIDVYSYLALYTYVNRVYFIIANYNAEVRSCLV